MDFNLDIITTTLEKLINKVTSWSVTPNNTNYPSEKLVKDSLDNLQDQINSGAVAVGSQVLYYLDITESLADNYTLSNSPSIYPETINTKALTVAGSPVLFERFVSAPLNKTTIPAGVWTFNFYAKISNASGLNTVDFRINQRIIVSGILGTWSGTGILRTFTASSGTPFSGLITSGNRLSAPLIETPNQTGWITVVNSSTSVTVNITDIGYINESNVPLSAIYYYLFGHSTADVNSLIPALYIETSVQPEFTVGVTDRIVLAVFGTTDGGGTRDMSLYYGGDEHYTHFETPPDVLLTSEQISYIKPTGTTAGTLAAGDDSRFTQTIQFACSDETTLLTTGLAKISFRMPFAMTLTAVRGSVVEAATGVTLLTVDINEGGVSILSTELTFDASELTTTTATTPYVISDTNLADDALITVDIDSVGSTLAGKGLKITLIGTR